MNSTDDNRISIKFVSEQIKSNKFYLDTAYLTNDSGVFTIIKKKIMIKKKNKKQITIIYITIQSMVMHFG